MIKSNKGFTLIELMVVISIIAILATLGILSYRQATNSARDSKRRADLEVVRQALILYRSEHGCYPGAGTTAALSAPNYDLVTGVLVDEGFLSEPVPEDPATNTYRYQRLGAAINNCNGETGSAQFLLQAILSDGTPHDVANP